jgi:uncharacterized protein YggT (Ycf19 family)
MEIILETLLWGIKCIVELYFIINVVNVALYWCMHFNLIGQGGVAFKKLLTLLHAITEPVYSKLREYIKPVQGFDVSPYVLIVALLIIGHILEQTCRALNG